MIDEARKALLTNCVETYLRLDESEQKLYEQLLLAHQEVREMLTVYEERGIVIGTVRGKRDATLRVLRKRFGDLPEPVEARVRAMETEAELDALLDAALNAQSLGDLSFDGKKKKRGRRKI